MEKMERMVYGAVANGSGIIVYHSDFFELNPIIQALVSSIDFSQDQRRSFGAHERTKGHTVQYVVESGRAYISAATNNFPHKVCFRFLENIATEYRTTDFSSPKSLSQFEHFIRSQLKFFTDEENDQLPTSPATKSNNNIELSSFSNLKTTAEREESFLTVNLNSDKMEEKSSIFSKQSSLVPDKKFDLISMIRNNLKATFSLIAIIAALSLVATLFF